ncbi:MAG TPA: hypothetical protein VFE45_11820, partial [Coriobacteriia bacterium]|nr:hypothetical protein [Coriobacteriia bacterium]
MSKPTRKRARHEPGPPRLPLWRVTILAHEIPLRWSIPATQITVGAVTAESACHAVIRIAHIRARVAPLRSLLALSVQH